MSVEVTDLNAVRSALSDSCSSTCTATKRQAMMALEHYQMCDGYIESLVRIVDVNDVGATMTLESRHLAAVLLKNVISKRGASLDKQSKACAGMRPLLITEKNALKAFLARYMYEPQCKVALQLSLAVAKLARLEGDSWVKDWPELITSIVTILQGSMQPPPNSPGDVSSKPVIPVDGASYGCTIRAICTLQELLSELSAKAASCCSSPAFVQGYASLCAQLYCIVSKSWACNMKKLQPILTAFNSHAAGHYTNAHFLSTSVPDVAQITGYTAREIESLFAHTILLSKVMRIVVEFGFEKIGTAYPTFYTSFWKSYLGSIKLLADFVRAHRSMCVEILKHRTATNASINNNKRTSEHLVYMKHILMTEDDADDPCDAYFPVGNEQAPLGDTISILNLSLKLLKSLVCAPVILQMKYPTLVLPSLEAMVNFAYMMITEEFPHAMQEYELSGHSPCNDVNTNTTNFIQVLTFEQAHTLYTLEALRNALPLSYLVKACSMLLSNVLKCSAYCEYNVYTNTTTSSTATNSTTAINDTMEECAHKSSTSSGYELKTTFFTTERVSTLVRMLLYPLLTYTKKELNEWMLNPEEFIISQQDCEATFSVKTAAENLFFNVAEYAPEVVCSILAPLLMDCVRQEAIYSPNNIHTNSNNEILAVYRCSVVSRYVHNRELCIWDAVYMCTGLGIAHLSSYFCKLKEQYNNNSDEVPCHKCPNFSNNTQTSPAVAKNECGENGGASYWVQHYLGPMVTQLLKNPYSGCLEHKQQLLRSRLIWLLGVWMHKFEQSVLPHVLTILIDIISPGDSDIVVRMYAVEALHKLVNLNVFDVTTLVYYVVKAVEALCLMVRTLEESENKIAVLHLSGELIHLLSIQLTSLRPLVVPLAGYLENLWAETGHTDPTRSTILEVMTQLVRASKHFSATILPITTPLIMFALSTGSNSYSVGPARSTDCDNESPRVRSKCSGGYGYLVKDGLALWLAVMQNLTAEQYSTYHKELQHVFSVCMTSLHISNTPTPTTYTTDAFVYNNWDIQAEPDSAVLITDILLCVEAYCLLGGEGYSLLSDLNCRNALTALYMKCLGKVDVKLVQYVLRPLQALVVSCPSLAGAYLNECGLLAQIIRIIMASAPCVNLQSLVATYKTTDTALVSYLTLVAYILYVDPSTLYSALTVFVAEVVSYVSQCTGTKCDKVLTEAILLQQIVGVMTNVHSSVKSHNAPLYTYKLWSLALLTLIPPTLINNAPLLSPMCGAGNTTTSNTNSTKGLAAKPDCIFARIMLKLLNTVQCTFGKECLEQYQRDYCASHTNTTSASLDYSTLSFWYPSTLSTEQLYGMVDSIVNMCKCTLKSERRKGHTDALSRQLDELLQGGSGEGLSMETSNMGNMSEMFLNCDSSDSSDNSVGDEDGNDTDSEDTECMNCTSTKENTTDNTVELSMSAGITAAEGDAQQLDVCELPLRTVLRTRLTESYILNAKVEVHLKEKCTQLRRVLGEEHYATLRCIAELSL